MGRNPGLSNTGASSVSTASQAVSEITWAPPGNAGEQTQAALNSTARSRSRAATASAGQPVTAKRCWEMPGPTESWHDGLLPPIPPLCRPEPPRATKTKAAPSWEAVQLLLPVWAEVRPVPKDNSGAPPGMQRASVQAAFFWVGTCDDPPGSFRQQLKRSGGSDESNFGPGPPQALIATPRRKAGVQRFSTKVRAPATPTRQQFASSKLGGLRRLSGPLHTAGERFMSLASRLRRSRSASA
mmetsp:Transcript_81951/g.228414  ORF Transcript_81951/g.228414 Transcript_81951/m.228414 type:complete len:241 (-) Transcript_81951:70-792(-)